MCLFSCDCDNTNTILRGVVLWIWTVDAQNFLAHLTILKRINNAVA